MTAPRSGSLIPAHPAISASERPHPMHKADCGSMTQTLTQGVDIAGAGVGRI